MEWIKARLREDSTRSGIGQLGVVVLVVCLLLGVDVSGLITQAQVTLDRLVAGLAAVAALTSSVSRIVSAEPPKLPPELPALDPAAIEGLKRLAEHLGPRP